MNDQDLKQIGTALILAAGYNIGGVYYVPLSTALQIFNAHATGDLRWKPAPDKEGAWNFTKEDLK